MPVSYPTCRQVRISPRYQSTVAAMPSARGVGGHAEGRLERAGVHVHGRGVLVEHLRVLGHHGRVERPVGARLVEVVDLQRAAGRVGDEVEHLACRAGRDRRQVPDAPVAVGAPGDDAHAAGGVGVEVAAVELGACRSEDIR
jgi:hypothetical protein